MLVINQLAIAGADSSVSEDLALLSLLVEFT